MSDIEKTFQKLRVVHEGVTHLLPCVDLTLYFAGPVHDYSDGIVKFYERSLELIQPKLKFFRNETMGAARPLKKDSLGLLPLWLKKTATRRDIYMLYLESGDAPDESSDSAFAFTAQPGKGYVRLVLPTSFALESKDEYLELALELGRTFKFDSGQAGYAINWNWLREFSRPAVQQMNALAKRYPGLDMSFPNTTQFLVTKGFKCVNWLTFLGADYLKALGGKAKLAKSFDDEVVIHELGGSVAIQAGSAPQIGDRNRKDTVPIYHEVGRVLAPVRGENHPNIFGPGGIPDREATHDWLGRFDE